MSRIARVLPIGLIVLGALASAAQADPGGTVAQAGKVVNDLAAIPARCIPAYLLQESVGVAVIPHVVKAGLILDERFGRGVIMVREPGGRWSNPVFVTLTGTGIGLQAGVEATDLVMVFKTRASLDRALQGKLTLGADVSVAAGPLGREAERATDRRLLKAEIFTYSRSHGLFAGASFEGARIHVDPIANAAFYGMRNCRPEDVLGHRVGSQAAAEVLKGELARLSGAPVLIPAQPVIGPGQLISGQPVSGPGQPVFVPGPPR